MKEKETSQQPEEQNEILGDKPDEDKLIIVGMGASAGGIAALKEFFENTPADTGMAFVVILHLSPDHDSQLAQILQATSFMPVTQVKEEVTVQKNHVYVISPNQHLEMLDGKIIVSENRHIEDRRAPVDIFFRTLAESHSSHSVAVVLSGTGANGSMGMKRIKERGGVCFVQNPREAEFNEMPRNSIDTGLVDGILNVRDIPAKIIAYKNSLGKVKISEEPVERPEEQQQALREIFTQIRINTGHDFTNYKRPTLLRRIERRVNVHNLSTLSEYALYLREHPEETQALLKDLLISVTNFFRDGKVFDYLEHEIIPRILAGKGADAQVRIWVAGCATGEEAYSLAMLFTEQLPAVDAPKIQIFATDIDEAAIAAARDGCYTINDAADVSPERLHRFFVKEGDEYRIRRELREMVLFARHNAVKDPPFSHLDLVTCRNLLIYLNQVAQERLMETFHFALDPNKYLILGMSETIDGSGDLYTAVNRELHIYTSRQTPMRLYPVPESVPQFRFEQQRINETEPQKESSSKERISFGQLHNRLLEGYAPPSIVINQEYEIVHLSETAGKFLQMAGGEPTQNLLKLIKPELRLELRSALYQALQLRTNVEVKNLKVKVDDATKTINVHIRPVLEEGKVTSGFILVLFEPVEHGEAQPMVISRDEPVARHLEEELTRLKVQLRTSIEQHEFQSEELKASNEELQAMNEELRSATEELETSREELQSINEELITVNQELKIKVEEISLSENNLHNLINSTDIGTLFLDRSFRINMFTPAARNIFNLITNDFGRSLSDITHKLKDVNLRADGETVINTLVTIEREVETSDGKIFLMHISPYRTAEDRINGVVVTFVDITQRKKTEKALSKSEERFRAFVTASTDVIYTMSADWSKMYNLRSEGFLANTDNLNTTWLEQYIPETDQPRVFDAAQKAIDTKTIFELEHRVIRVDGSIGWVFSRAVPVFDAQNEIVEWFGAATDVTNRIEAGQLLENSEQRLQLAIKGAGIFTWEVNPLTGFTKNAGDIKDVLGFDTKKNAYLNFLNIHPEDSPSVLQALKDAMTGKALLDVEYRIVSPDTNEIIWVKAQGQLMKRTPNAPAVFIGITQNITIRKFAEEALQKSEERLMVTMESAADYAIITTNEKGRIEWWNTGAERIFQYKAAEVFGKSCSIIFSREDQASGEHQKEMKIAREQGYCPIERWHPRKDGTPFYMSGIIRPIYNPELTGFVKVARDMTEQRRAAERLKIAEERYRIALQSANMAAWDWNVKENIIVWNDQHYYLFGLQPDDKQKSEQFFLQFIHEDDIRMVTDALEKAVKETGVYHAEFRIKRADNKQICWMNGYGKVVTKENEVATRMVGVMFDITERKKLEQQKDDFISVASHELKTPVTSIKAYAEVLHDMFRESENPESAALMQKLDVQVDRLIDLIRALLDTSKMAEGELTLNFEKFDLCNLIEERLQDLQQLSTAHTIKVIQPKEIYVTADRERIGQVLTNFISNAIKYSPKGGNVTIEWKCEKDAVQVSVQDEGIGIAEEAQQKIFDRFFRVKNAQIQSFPGMGLGLYITANIVQRHGGKIWVESKPGKGSTFYFIIPVSST